jgi:hypothetical protein
MSVTMCNGSKITQLHVDEKSIYPETRGLIDLNINSTSELLHTTQLQPYCTYGMEPNFRHILIVVTFQDP